MAGSRGSYIRTAFPSTIGYAFLQGDFIAWGQVQVQRDLILPHNSEPVAVVRGFDMLIIFGLSKLTNPWSWGWGLLHLNYVA